MNLLILLLLLIFVGVFIFNKFKKVDYIPNDYEKELISYFKEVALKTEYGNNPKKILKWEKSMKIYVVDANKRQLKAINKAINQINSLILNNFKVELVDEQKKCNTILYICSMDYIKENNPFFYSQFSLIDFEPDGFFISNGPGDPAAMPYAVETIQELTKQLERLKRELDDIKKRQ